MPRHTREVIEEHMSPDRPLHDVVRETWMRDNRARFEADEAAEEGWRDHWRKVGAFMDQLAQLDGYLL
jgi:hypothetical protein